MGTPSERKQSQEEFRLLRILRAATIYLFQCQASEQEFLLRKRNMFLKEILEDSEA